MSDLISRQDVIEKINERARETVTLALGYEYYLGALHDVADDLRQMPVIDAKPIVRCKDCKWWTKQEASLQGRCDAYGMYPTGEWYCARGERKDSDV